MPIYIHLSNLIVDKQAVQSKYPGGVERFRMDFDIAADNYHQEDATLFALATMNSDEFDLGLLINKGLHFDEERGSSTDFVIINRYGGAEWPAAWLCDNSLFAWHVNAAPESISLAEELGNETMDNLSIRYERGEDPFATIW